MDKKYLKCKKFNHFESAWRLNYKINEINDTNSNTESNVDITKLYIDNIGSTAITKGNKITLDAVYGHTIITMKGCWQIMTNKFFYLLVYLIWIITSTVKPPYSGHPLCQTPLYNGHFSQERMKSWSNSHNKTPM